MADENRLLGAMLFNATWGLIERDDRDADDDLQMLLTACASRFHWGEVDGADIQRVTGDWQVSHVACLVGFADVALRFAERALAAAQRLGLGGFRLASAHEGVARAHAVAGDYSASRRHIELADAALALEVNERDATAIREQIASIPRSS